MLRRLPSELWQKSTKYFKEEIAMIETPIPMIPDIVIPRDDKLHLNMTTVK